MSAVLTPARDVAENRAPRFESQATSYEVSSVVQGSQYSTLKHECESHHWDEVVCAAATRLNDSWVLPNTRCHAAGAGLEEELAAFMCAFGVLA